MTIEIVPPPPAPESVQANVEILQTLYVKSTEIFLKLDCAENSQHYTNYFLFALKQDSSLADTLTDTHRQKLLNSQDGQIDAAKLAGLFTKFTCLTECQPLKEFLNAKSLANMDSLCRISAFNA